MILFALCVGVLASLVVMAACNWLADRILSVMKWRARRRV